MARLLTGVLLAGVLCIAVHGQAQDLDQKVTVAMIQHATYESLISNLAQKAGLRVVVEPGALSDVRSHRPPYVGFVALFEDIPLRYALSWTLHFSNASACITNQTLLIQKPGLAVALTGPLSSCAETNGAWVAAIANLSAGRLTLHEKEIGSTLVLELLCHHAGIRRYVIDPDLVAGERQMHVDFTNYPAVLALDRVLNDLGAERVLQGGVHYLRRNSATARTEGDAEVFALRRAVAELTASVTSLTARVEAMESRLNAPSFKLTLQELEKKVYEPVVRAELVGTNFTNRATGPVRAPSRE